MLGMFEHLQSWTKYFGKTCLIMFFLILFTYISARQVPVLGLLNVPNHRLALVQPYFDYCSTLWGNCGKSLQDKLQKFQSRAARVITGASYDVWSTDILTTLCWETLDNRRTKSKAVFMYKVLSDHAALGLKESFHVRNVTQNT